MEKELMKIKEIISEIDAKKIVIYLEENQRSKSLKKIIKYVAMKKINIVFTNTRIMI